MTSLDRTIYLYVKRSSTTKELIEAYTQRKKSATASRPRPVMETRQAQ
jgi:hypothetical protein